MLVHRLVRLSAESIDTGLYYTCNHCRMSELPKGFNIRGSNVDDSEGIYELMKELASYEELYQVTVTLDQFREDGFGSNPFYRCLVVEKADEAPDKDGDKEKTMTRTKLLGYALFYRKYSSFAGYRSLYLEDLYVTPAFRKQGIGMSLLKEVAKVAFSEGCVRLDFSVVPWNESAIDFYRKLGAIDAAELEKRKLFRIVEEPLRKLVA